MRMILLMMLVLLLCPLVYAQYLVVPSHQQVQLEIPCDFNGGSCPDTTQCNLTVHYPNRTLFLNQRPMSKINDTFNYTYPLTNITGDYSNYAVCCSTSLCDADSFLVRIGNNFQLNQCPSSVAGILTLGLLFLLVIVLIIVSMSQRIGILGIFASIGLIFLGTLLHGCHILMGWIVVGSGMFLILYFALKNWY